MKHTTDSITFPIPRRRVLSLGPRWAALTLFAMVALQLRAAEPLKSGQWWGTLEVGAGQVERSTPGFSDNNSRFYLGFAGGVAVNPHVLLGAEFGGWLVKSGDLHDPTKGSGISQAFAVARIYPQATSTLHLQLGAGSIKGWDNSPTGSNHSGTGWEAGLGYDAMFSTHGAITPFVRYSNGKAGMLKLSAVTVGVGFTWR